MRSENEVRAMLEKLTNTNDALFNWGNDNDSVFAIINALLWVLGEEDDLEIDC